ncbi:SIS domain-containing protein [Gimibacter soli]
MTTMSKKLQDSDTKMFAEAGTAGAVVARQIAATVGILADLGAKLREMKPRAVVTCARGSSDHAATYAKYLIETKLGLLVSSAAPSIASVYAARQMLEGTLFIAVSQSGKSPDLLLTAEAAKASGAFVVALVNVADSPLAKLADVVVPLSAGPELSVAATKSYIATLAAILGLVAHWSEDKELMAALEALPRNLEAAWGLDWSGAAERLISARNMFVIGRGLGFAVTQEAALKFKETSGIHAEGFSAAEVKHGPMAIVGHGFPVLVMSQKDESRAGIPELVHDFEARGAAVMTAGVGLKGGLELPVVEGAHPAIEPILFIQSFYRMVNRLSVLRGYNPDTPPHLNKVTETV